VQQAEGIKISAEHLRRNRPRVMGSLYWQLNDCWPVASWASLDYYGRWKALHYYAKRFYAPVLVSPHEENSQLAIYVVSDLPQAIEGARLHLELVDFAGKKVWEKEQSMTVAPLASAVAFQIPLNELLAGADKDAVVLRAELFSGGELIASNDHFFDEIFKHLKLPASPIEATVVEAGGKKVVRLHARNLAAAVYVSFGETEAHAADNYFNLLAGETRELQLTSNASTAELQKQLKVVSLKDAF
jgi:beta-mannosidase